jgi:hypothetical protein
MQWGTRRRSWLRHCATSRKIAGSIADAVIRIFHWHNPSGRTMALGLIQSLTEMSTRNISWGYRRPVRRADNLTIFMCRLSWNLGVSTTWNPQGLSRPVMGLLMLRLRICCAVLSLPNIRLWRKKGQLCSNGVHPYLVKYQGSFNYACSDRILNLNRSDAYFFKNSSSSTASHSSIWRCA